MKTFNQEQLENAVDLISTTITKCEKMQIKFLEGTSQDSLLKNRIKALCISKALILGDNTDTKIQYTNKDVREALPPVVSIINKTTKAQSKYEKGTSQFNRHEPIIQAMFVAKQFIENEINKNR
ncbi:hypothetical protein J2Z32_001156 [Paenibacillus turicensis]|uniref:HEPN domain-containing protein n=1 Tax=Paenibacillus turicensis TaxID=160487 RepID=A0ABS4FPM0_9BACL|nr:hypothetical protein [Paenibacillus turicensis]MBP1904533.1 hypothetical protein [Paenibacillus turicensis]